MALWKGSDLTRAIRAARAAGVESFEATLDDSGRPVIKVRPANDRGEAAVREELEAWAREQDDAA